MKYRLLPCLILVLMVASCSTAYKSTQTPDDVYYSPAPPAVADNENNKDEENKYEEYVSSQDDQYIRMKIRNRNKWQLIDDYEYWNDTRYNPFSTYNYYQNNWNSWYTWNSWNNPFYTVGYSNPCCCYSAYNNIKTGYYYPVKVPGTTRSNLGSFHNSNYSNTNQNTNVKNIINNPTRGYNNKNNSSSSGSTDRSYTPSSNSSSGSSSSSGGVSRPKKG